MSVLLTRYWILHDHHFVNRDMKENSAISTYCLLKRRIDPIVHVMARISRTIEQGINCGSKDFPILFVIEPCSYVSWKRAWIEKHAQPCCGWCRWSRHCDIRWRYRRNSSCDCIAAAVAMSANDVSGPVVRPTDETRARCFTNGYLRIQHDHRRCNGIEMISSRSLNKSSLFRCFILYVV